MMKLKLFVFGASEDELKKALITEADKWFGDQKYKFYDVTVTANIWDPSAPTMYEAEAVVVAYNSPSPMPAPVDDDNDPFATGYGPAW